MDKNDFFKPTLLYKEYFLLNTIENYPNITQREMSSMLNVAVSMVNEYLNRFEESSLIFRKKHSTKKVEYCITQKGLERRKLLNVWYLQASHNIFLSAKNNILEFFNYIYHSGFQRILLYGAGEVAEILIQVIHDDGSLPIQVLAVVDDNLDKQGEFMLNLLIIDKEEIKFYEHDGILVSSYIHHQIINRNLKSIGYPQQRIINFF